MGGSRIVVEWARGPKVNISTSQETSLTILSLLFQYDYRQDHERHRRERG